MRLTLYRIGSMNAPHLLQSYSVPGINRLMGYCMKQPALLSSIVGEEHLDFNSGKTIKPHIRVLLADHT